MACLDVLKAWRQEFGIGKSMNFRVDDGDAAPAFKEIALVGARCDRAVRQMWFALMRDLFDSASREVLVGSKSGRLYRYRGMPHRASAPGQSHANMSGKALKSLSWKVHGSSGADFGYGVSVTARNAAPPYVDALEYGRLDGLMAPRPTLQNELDHVGAKAQAHFSDALEDAGL